MNNSYCITHKGAKLVILIPCRVVECKFIMNNSYCITHKSAMIPCCAVEYKFIMNNSYYITHQSAKLSVSSTCHAVESVESEIQYVNNCK